MCRALKVLCVAEDAESLAALKRATVSADWELAPGACSEAGALEQLESERPHVVVVFGAFGRLVATMRERVPYLRIVTDRDLPGANAVAASPEEVRAAVKGLPRPGGPVRGG
ncbi:MAG TPA: hypothetical protein VFC04_09045 [Actinomycetota bacterium]|jgi:hypothetical protein|nr:hypothetical protein [Actinomycetota bacterium]